MKLLDAEKSMGIVTKTWKHTDGAGNDVITTETTQDVNPTFKKVKELSRGSTSKDFKFAASIPANVVNDLVYKAAASWGVKPKAVFEELMASKTDRAKELWRTMVKGRDYRKFQAGNY